MAPAKINRYRFGVTKTPDYDKNLKKIIMKKTTNKIFKIKKI